MVELQKLCDKVPSFDSKIAFETMERELGRPVDEVFSEITPEPVAAASLGQVYKATLRATGETVAVKVRVDMRGEHAMKIGCLEHLSLTSALSCTLFHS
jgi:predicted unusual protein kinase regulating ubiquinone biosynthesis (AarF/ABC1/UbiB family)